LKGAGTLHRLRATLAILIALSLTLAPITSAWAAAQMRASMDAVASVSTASDDAMSDCMKAMQAQGQEKDQDCPCCDTPSKAPCSDVGACLAKCSFHVIAILVPAAENRPTVVQHSYPTAQQKPPDWSLSPPAPPPRA
jgi:hypothetical protein